MSRAAKGEGSLYEFRKGFRAYITVRGQRKYFYFPNVTKSQASVELRALLGQRDLGTLPKGKDYTLAVWMRHWLVMASTGSKTRKKLSPGTAAGYAYNVEHYIIPALGTVKLRALEPEDLEGFYEDLLSGVLSRPHLVDGKVVKNPLAARSVRNVHSNIRRALHVAMQRGHVGRNVALLVDAPAASVGEMKRLSSTDAQLILSAASGQPREARWYLGLVFGMRPSEVLGLTWQDIDATNSHVKVRRQLQRIAGAGIQLIPSVKTDASHREIPLPKRVFTMLDATRAAQMRARVEYGDEYVEWEFDGQPVALVFTQPNGAPIDIKVDTRAWQKLLDAAGLPHERRYIGRHTAASVMVDMGMDIAVISAILGHSKTSFTYDTYVHPLEAQKRSAADLLGDMYS